MFSVFDVVLNRIDRIVHALITAESEVAHDFRAIIPANGFLMRGSMKFCILSDTDYDGVRSQTITLLVLQVDP